MTSASSHSHHNHQSHNQWARLQQRIRRNCLVGPATVCLLVIVGMPYMYSKDAFGSLRVSMPMLQVEAVPFFRKAKVFGVVGGAVASVTGIYFDGQDPLDPFDSQDSQETEQDPEPAAGTTTTATATATLEPPKKKQKLDKKSATATATDDATYNFPLFPEQDSFASDPNAPIPVRYLDAHGKEDIARQATLDSLQWRQQYQIDTMLSRPHPNYDIAKRVLPHYFIGRSAVTNHVVFVQRPGLADLALAKHNDLVIQDMLLQYAYVFEYCWNVLHPHQTSATDKDALMIGILDMQGLNLGILRKPELLSFVKEFVAMIDAQYPTRAYKTLMVNAPQWFSALYKVVSPIMRETTKEKIVLYSAGKQQDAALEEALGQNMAETVKDALRIPDKKEQKLLAKQTQEGHLTLTSDSLLETEMEQQIRNFVLQRLQEEGLEIKSIVSLAQPKP